MRDNIYYRWFQDSLTEAQRKEYRDMSINQQKDWYTSYLENHYSPVNYPPTPEAMGWASGVITPTNVGSSS